MEIDLVKHFRKNDGHGNGLIIKGQVRVGKTYLASVICRLLLKEGFAVISNLRFANEVYDGFKGRLFYITNDQQFFESYLTISENTPIVLVWDDIQTQEGFKSTHVVRKSGDMLASFLIYIGKLDCNYIYIAHQKYIPDCIIEGFEPLIIYKLYRNNFYLGTLPDVEHLELSSNDILANPNIYEIPMPADYPPLPIQSKALASFTFDLDLNGLWHYLARFEVGENLRPALKEYLALNSDDREYDALRKLTYADLVKALFLKRPNMTGKEKVYELINPTILYPTIRNMNGKFKL